MLRRPAMDILLAGATGLVGRSVVAQWQEPGQEPSRAPPWEHSHLHWLVRRRSDLAELADIGGLGAHGLVVDFANLPCLPAATAAICCLGTTIAQAGSRAAFRAVDLDAVLAFARAAQVAGAQRFGLVSAMGADPGSVSFYSRVKGEAEAAVQALGFQTLVIVRPSLLLGDRAAIGQPDRPAERLAQSVAAPLAALIPARWRPVPASAVARALLHEVTTAGPGLHRIESAALHGNRKGSGSGQHRSS